MHLTSLAMDHKSQTSTSHRQVGFLLPDGIYNSNLNNVGIGTSAPRFNLELGPVGSEDTSLYVNGKSEFIGFVELNDIIVGGALTATGTFDFANAKSGNIQASSVAIGTSEPSQPFQVGSGTTEDVCCR